MSIYFFEDMFEKLKQFDAYSKTSDEYRVKTFSGATSEFCLSLSVPVCVCDYYASLISLNSYTNIFNHHFTFISV